MRCWWCHNPEGLSSAPELMFRKNRCIKCNECLRNCPKEALTFSTKHLYIDRKDCSLCGKCAQKCPTDALATVGKEMDVEEVMKEVCKDSAFYDESGGGITVSGGEPLLQIDFLDALLTECKKKNIHTAVDTSGFAPRESFKRIKDRVDLFLYDIKTMNNETHRKYTGVSNKQILENFKTLAQNGSDLLVRFPVVPGINDDEDNVAKMAEFIFSCGVRQICLLPYHKAGIEKYRGLGKSYKLKTVESPSDQKLSLMKKQLEAFGLSVKVGG